MQDVLLFPDSNFHNNGKKMTLYGECLFYDSDIDPVLLTVPIE